MIKKATGWDGYQNVPGGSVGSARTPFWPPFLIKFCRLLKLPNSFLYIAVFAPTGKGSLDLGDHHPDLPRWDLEPQWIFYHSV